MVKTIENYVKKGLFYEAVVEDGSDLIFVVDYQGKILYHNSSVQETLGYKSKSLNGKNFFDFILPETLPLFKLNYQRSTKKQYQKSIEFQFLCKDKSYKYLEFNSINLKQKDKSKGLPKIEGLILDCRDITERKRDAAELLQAQKTKDQFLANISHEIRTPINGIAGMVTLLSKNPSKDDQIVYLNAIKSASENLKVIINDILDLASIESGKLKFERIGFKLKDVMISLSNMFIFQAKEKGITITNLIHKDADKIFVGDPVRLNQILINLISNSLKFTHTGTVNINCSIEKKERQTYYLRVEVIDTGIGIPADKLTTIFESFSQADASVTRKYGGTGLGLTIVKQLVELQQGTISVKSEDGKGSSFVVVIPYQKGNQKDIAQLSNQVSKGKLQKKSLSNLNVLLVEDNDINRLYAINILKTWKCNVDTAENGFVALEKLKNSSFDIILMDIQMPVMDGFEATKAIRNGPPPKNEIPIIALTANATKKDVEKCLASNMDDCIPKPFTPNELLKVLLRFSKDKIPPKIKAPKTFKSIVDLNYLRQISNNNPKFIQEMVITFVNSMPDTLEEIKHLAKTGSWIELAKVIHKIKPSLTMMGLHHAKKMSLEIEQNYKNNPKGISIKNSKFIKLIEQAIVELRTITS